MTQDLSLKRRATRWTAAALCLGMFLAMTPTAQSTTAPGMDKYTAYPVFVNKTVPPNILFVLDLSEKMLEAAYGYYPESSGGKISSNVTGAGLCNVNQTGSSASGCPTSSGTTDTFDTTKTYFGMFDGTRCYTYSSNEFHPDTSTSKSATSACSSNTMWDGNFLNWLTMRKTDLAKKVLVGGKGSSAQCNSSGYCNKLLAEDGTGSDGGSGTCSNSSSTCFRFVKAVTFTTSQYYYPTSVPGVTSGSDKTTYFGVGEGDLFASNTGTEDGIFKGTGSGVTQTSYDLTLDLTSESTTVQQAQSQGLFQSLRTDQMRVAVMFTNSNSTDGVAGNMQMSFDTKLTSSVYTNIRNTALRRNAPLAETLYEGLCYYRQNSSACFSHSPANWTQTLATQGDPYYFCNKDANGDCSTPVTGQMVACCKSYVLMLTSGQPLADGDSTPSSTPFGNLMNTGVSNRGLTTTQLDDVGYYGKRNDLRSTLTGTQNVTLYTVNMMGGSSGGALLASGSKWGGFEDSDGDGLPNSSGQTCTYPTGSVLGTAGSSGTSSSEWDLNKDCEPDTYFNANEGSDLETAINLAIADILKKSASGTAASVLASSSTGEGAVYQAYFYPTDPHGITGKEIKWTGYTTSLFIDSYGNFREDTDSDGKLVYGNDDIVRLRYDDSSGDVMVERYRDVSPADGKADSTTPYYSSSLTNTTMRPLWEAGSKLADLDVNASCSTAVAGVSCRRIWTWIDTNHNGAINSGEDLVEFTQSNVTRLTPYLNVSASTSALPTLTAAGLINFVRGCNGYASGSSCTEQQNYRDRRVTINSVDKLWRYGDPINSTPTLVGAPRERYDLIYGDSSYGDFYKRYKDRRQVLYVGANDGMLHALNAGFYHKGDDATTTGVEEHGWFTTDSSGAPTAASARSNPDRGAELWAFIPYELLPHLQWLARPDYGHVYYVDLKPKVTDVRIFTDDGATGHHPGGWGTILIAGFRFGGSCGNCNSTNGAPPMTYTATFESSIGSQDRTFYSAYIVLDITDPERDPILLGVFTNQSGVGLTTSYPTIVRANPSTAPSKTDNTNAKWFAVFGSGPTGYKGNTSSSQASQLYTLELKGDKTGTVSGPYSTGDTNAFMGDLIAYDGNLDYRVDAVYGGNDICNSSACSGTGSPAWKGKMYRLTTGSGTQTSPASWDGPKVLIQEFSCVMPCTGTNKVGPITAAPTITSDDSNNVWVFFGSGRYWDEVNDKTNTDTQYFIGVKDLAMNGSCDSTTTDCQQKDLLDVSSAVVCSVCASGTTQVTGVTGVTTFSGLVTAVTGKKGWYTTMPTSGERNLSTPTLLGGTLLMTSFVPATDLCVVTGSGYLYALFYLTGSAYSEPLIGTYTSGSNTNVSRSLSLGTGLPSSVAVQLTRQGSSAVGSTGGPAPCSGGLNAVVQSSTAVLNQVCGKPALSAWSRYLSWINNRDS